MRSIPVAISLVVAAGLTACSSSGSGGPSSPPSTASVTGPGPANAAQAVAEIKANWATFFHTGTDRLTAIALLQDGNHLGAAIKAAAKLAREAGIAEDAKVSNVVFTNPRTATVTYDLLGNGKSLLPTGSATGTAVFEHGGWKVSKATFCSLVELGTGTNVRGCS